MISQIAGSEHPVKIKNLALPDAPVITGNSREVFDYYNLNAEGIVKEALEILKDA
jgi:transketolase